MMSSKPAVKSRRGLSTGVILQDKIDFGLDPKKLKCSCYDQQQRGCLTLWKYQFASNGTQKTVSRKPAQKAVTKSKPKAMPSGNPKVIPKSRPKALPKPPIKKALNATQKAPPKALQKAPPKALQKAPPKPPQKVPTKNLPKPVPKGAANFQPGKAAKESATPLRKILVAKKARQNLALSNASKAFPKPAPKTFGKNEKTFSRMTANQKISATPTNFRAMMQTLTKDRRMLRLSGGSDRKQLPTSMKPIDLTSEMPPLLPNAMKSEETPARPNVIRKFLEGGRKRKLESAGLQISSCILPMSEDRLRRLLLEIIRMLDTQKKTMPKGERPRLVKGFFDIQCLLADRTKKPKLFIVAKDHTKATLENRIEESKEKIKNHCLQYEVPCIIGLTRRHLGFLANHHEGLDCVALLSCKAMDDRLEAMLQETEVVRPTIKPPKMKRIQHKNA